MTNASETLERLGAERGARPARTDVALPVALGLPLVIAILTRANAVYQYRPELPEVWGGEMPAVAHSIASGFGFASPFLADTGPTALLPPLYPYLLAGIFRVFDYSRTAAFVAMGINVVFSALVVIPLFLLIRNLFGNRPAMLSAWLWALFALTGQTDAVYVWSTSLFALQLTMFLALTASLRVSSTVLHWGAFAGLAGIMILTDPVSLTVIAVSAAWLFGTRVLQDRDGRTMLKRLALAAVVASVLPGIWMARNFIEFRKIVFVRSGLGLEFDVGVRDFELTGNPPRSLPNRDPAELVRWQEMGELRYVAYRGAHAGRWIREHPVEYASRTIKRVFSFWTGRYQMSDIYLAVGRSMTVRSVFFSIPAIGALLAMVGMLRMGHRARWWVVGILALYPLVYYLTHTLPRYRMPLEPLLIGLTAWVCIRLEGRRAES